MRLDAILRRLFAYAHPDVALDPPPPTVAGPRQAAALRREALDLCMAHPKEAAWIVERYDVPLLMATT